jgi:hypothetical protein
MSVLHRSLRREPLRSAHRGPDRRQASRSRCRGVNPILCSRRGRAVRQSAHIRRSLYVSNRSNKGRARVIRKVESGRGIPGGRLARGQHRGALYLMLQNRIYRPQGGRVARTTYFKGRPHNFPNGKVKLRRSHTPQGVIGGAHVGYNLQRNSSKHVPRSQDYSGNTIPRLIER